jgi:hypothetical protein
MDNLAIATGASQNHFKSLKQFLGTVPKSQRCFIYNLGLNKQSIGELDELAEQTGAMWKVCTFDYSKYPEYYNIEINAGEYAWKPAIICEVMHELLDKNKDVNYLLWSDAGNVLSPNSAGAITEFLRDNHIFTGYSLGNIAKWTHPLTLKWFSIGSSSPYMMYRCRNAAMMGFNISVESVVDFIDSLAVYASIKDCIAPPGSSRENHRQDQAVFTIMYYQYLEANTNIGSTGDMFGIKIHQDID